MRDEEGTGPVSPLASAEVLDLLASLVQKSLVLYEEDEHGNGRYRLLETVRQYARDRLLEAGEREAVRDRHLHFFRTLAEVAEPRLLRGTEQATWLDRLEVEHDNLRAALEWCVKAVDNGQWIVDSPAGPGQKTDRSLSELTTIHYPLTTAVEAGLRLAGALTWFWIFRGHLAEAWQCITRALSQAGDAPVPALAKTLYGGDGGGLPPVRRPGARGPGRGGPGPGTGNGRQLAHRSLFPAFGSGRPVAWPEDSKGSIAECVEARRAPGGQRQLHSGEITGFIAECPEALARLVGAEGHPESPHRWMAAARLYGAAEALREAASLPLPRAGRADYERHRDAVRAALGEEAFRGAWAEGRTMSREDTLACALAEADPA